MVLKGVLLVALLATSLGQIMPSCGGGEARTITGWVEDKYYHKTRESYVVVINNVEYNVPDDFFFLAEVGDLVARDENGLWRIVRKRGQ